MDDQEAGASAILSHKIRCFGLLLLENTLDGFEAVLCRRVSRFHWKRDFHEKPHGSVFLSTDLDCGKIVLPE